MADAGGKSNGAAEAEGEVMLAKKLKSIISIFKRPHPFSFETDFRAKVSEISSSGRVYKFLFERYTPFDEQYNELNNICGLIMDDVNITFKNIGIYAFEKALYTMGFYTEYKLYSWHAANQDITEEKINWSNISMIIVQPTGYTRGAFSVPPFYKLELLEKPHSLFIDRRPFFGHEEKVLEGFKKFAKCPISIKDKLQQDKL